MEKKPALPLKPAELIALESRRAVIRGQRQEVEAELERLQAEAWNKSESDADPLDLAAEKLVSGEIEIASRDALPEEVEILRPRRDLLQLAEAKLANRVAAGRAAHNRSVAGAYRPAHRKAAQRIARALRELVDANRAEEALRDRAPGGTLPPMDFPGVGQLNAIGGPAKFWMEHAARHGYLDEGDPEARFPAAAL